MLVEDAVIPSNAIRVRVSLLCPVSDLAGRAGIAWPDPRPNDLRNWALIVEHRPSVIYCHADILHPVAA
jgi:hypothetical protein